MKTVFNSVSRGLLFICLGVIFFLINFGILSWGFWLSVIDLWPLILILVGISLFFKKQIPFSLILMVFLIALASYSLIFGERYAPWDSLKYKVPYNSAQSNSDSSMATDVSLPADITKAELKINLGGASFNLGSLDPADSQSQLVKGSLSWENRFGDQPEFSTQQEGDIMKIKLSSNIRGGSKNSLTMNLSSKVKYSLDINAGAVDGKLDFSRLAIEQLNLRTGASKYSLQFGDNGLTTEGKIECGVSEITLVIPENVGLHVHFDGVACETDFMGDGLILDNKEWTSPEYDQARTKVNLDISCGAGSIHLLRPNVEGTNYNI